METVSDKALADIEIKDATVIFNDVWRSLEEEFGLEKLTFPKEIILLGGAPGAGKGTNTGFIMKARGFTCPPIVVSSLLDSPKAKALKDNGMLVGDREVMTILFRRMLRPEFRDGAILDGFPRSEVQVECMKLLVEKMNELHTKFKNTEHNVSFRRPTIHVMVLFVDEKTSVERQLFRGRQIEAHNEEVRQTGLGELQELRKTDLDVDAAKRRYRVFKESTWDALQSLREVFFYHLINAQGSIEEVERNIVSELTYQSSLELDPDTYQLIRDIPVAHEIVTHARQELVRRLDGYARDHRPQFEKVVQLINERFMPIIIRHAISGRTVINNEDEVLNDPLALAMMIDIFSDRGYHAVIDKQVSEVPKSVNLETGTIEFRPKTTYRIRIYFEGSEIRRGDR